MIFRQKSLYESWSRLFIVFNIKNTWAEFGNKVDLNHLKKLCSNFHKSNNSVILNGSYPFSDIVSFSRKHKQNRNWTVRLLENHLIQAFWYSCNSFTSKFFSRLTTLSSAFQVLDWYVYDPFRFRQNHHIWCRGFGYNSVTFLVAIFIILSCYRI